MKYLLLPIIKFLIKILLSIIITPAILIAFIIMTIWNFKFPSFEEKYSGYELKDNFNFYNFLHKKEIENLKDSDILRFKNSFYLIWWKPIK
jgi:hypothetical protein